MEESALKITVMKTLISFCTVLLFYLILPSTIICSDNITLVDNFDSLDGNRWVKVVPYLGRNLEKAKFKEVEISSQSGRLILKTAENAYSKGALSSRFALKGDFDVEVWSSLSNIDIKGIDKVMFVAVREADKEHKEANITIVQFHKAVNNDQGMFFAASKIGEDFKRGTTYMINSYTGGIRFIRKDNRITIMYKPLNMGWMELDSYPCSFAPMQILLGVSNFLPTDTPINPGGVLTVYYDDFKINNAGAVQYLK